MRLHWFSVLSVAGVILLTGNSFGGDLQWKKPESNEPVISPVLRIPTVISTDDSVETAILQAQMREPILPPQTIPSLDVQGQNPPSGATILNIPLTSSDALQTPAVERRVTGTAVPCDDRMGMKSIREISYDIRPTQAGEVPEECVIDSAVYHGRHFAQSNFQWKASAVATKAAYFEDVQLERYGHTVSPGLQPIISGAKFFGTIPILPYKMGVIPPNECVYTLGHYRVGRRSPYMVEPFPISPRGALFQAGAVAGVLAIP
jgi:hypothetical protein